MQIDITIIPPILAIISTALAAGICFMAWGCWRLVYLARKHREGPGLIAALACCSGAIACLAIWSIYAAVSSWFVVATGNSL